MKYYRQLIENLNKGKILPVNLFYGPESYLREQAIKQYKETLLTPEERRFNFELLDGSEVTEDQVMAAVSALPLLGQRRLVVIKGAQFFSAQKASTKGSALLNCIAAPFRTTCVIFETGEPVDRRRKLYKEVARLGGVVEFAKLKKAELAKWINQLARRQGKTISKEGIEVLLHRCGRDMYSIYNEMNKLIDYVGSKAIISGEEVRFLVTGRLEENIFAVVDALGEGKYLQALEGVQQLLLQKESPQAILGMLARQVRLIIQAREYSARGCDFSVAVKEMGIAPFVYKKALSQSRNFEREKLIRLLIGILKVDEYVKTGKQDFYTAVEMLFLKESVASSHK